MLEGAYILCGVGSCVVRRLFDRQFQCEVAAGPLRVGAADFPRGE